jgi:hypothetical protein
MKSQSEIIKNYKKAYPNDKLREVSKRTGINLTRVYRIFQGKEMSMGEFEIFNKLVDEKTNNRPECTRLQETVQKAIHLYPTQEIVKLINWIERKNFIYTYKNINF